MLDTRQNYYSYLVLVVKGHSKAKIKLLRLKIEETAVMKNKMRVESSTATDTEELLDNEMASLSHWMRGI